jgi:outer membrane protein OmpA-like peptidoglycan-associated protein
MAFFSAPAAYRLPRLMLASAILATVASCATQPIAVSGERYQNPRKASRGVANSLSSEFEKINAFSRSPSAILIGPTVTLASGEITKSGRELQTFLLLDLKAMLGNISVDRLGGENDIASANIITGHVVYEKPAQSAPEEAWFLVTLNIAKGSGNIVGEVAFRINARQFDPTPSRFFQNSPIFQHGVAYATSSSTNLSGASRKISPNIEINARIDRGVIAYEAGQFADSEKIFREVAVRDTENMAALSGIYQSAIALGKKAEAEQALDQLIDAGIRRGNLSFKFLFRVRSAEFRDDIEISSQYSQWINRAAHRLAKSNLCLSVEGHSSLTGSAEFNKDLSFKRAERVTQHLIRANPQLKSRIKGVGYGFAKNIVGSGTDDAKDAIDRRVEFRLHQC